MKLEYKIIKDNEYYNVKEILKEKFRLSNRLIIKLKKTKQIFLNNKPAYGLENLHTGDIIKVNLDFNETNENIRPTKMNLNILYEDNSLLIVNKPSNTPIHPSMNHYTDSLSNGVMYYFN